jgi:hypothetical protein
MVMPLPMPTHFFHDVISTHHNQDLFNVSQISTMEKNGFHLLEIANHPNGYINKENNFIQ